MAHLFLKDTDGDPDGVRFISTRDIQFDDEGPTDAVLVMFETDLEGNEQPMHPSGYTWQLHEVIQIRDFLNKVIEEETNAN